MAGLFEDILTNLQKKKQEGKISGGYRYKDGKLNIGGGYYGDDSMFEVDVNKDGGNILFKKRFADGGSTNGSGDKAFTAKVKELMDDGYELGEAVKEAMRQGYAKGGRINFDSGGSPLQKLKQEIVESMRPYAPGVSENKLQIIVKDITFDMSPEEAQASAVSNFQKLFGMANGGRVGYAKAGLVDPINNVIKGQDLGRGIQQRLKGKKIVYITSGLGDTPLTEHNTYKAAKDFRQDLIKNFDPATDTKEYKGKYNYKELIKDKDFEDFWKGKVDNISSDARIQGQGTNQEIEKVRKKYKLKPNDYEGIFNKLLEETRITEQVRKSRVKGSGKERLVSGKILDNLLATFNQSYKPYVGTIDTKTMGKLLKLSDGELEKVMTFMDKDYPAEKFRLTDSSDVSRIGKAAAIKKKLAAEGITYERQKSQYGKKGVRYRFKADSDIKKSNEKFKKLEKSKTFGFPKENKITKYPKSYKNKFTTLSKQSAEYKMQGYNKDRGTIFRLTKALNNAIKGMTDAQLKTFINKNPKIKNLVTSFFDARTGEIKPRPLSEMTMSQIRQNLQFEQDHIRGRSTVKYDAGTKKILDGLGIEYPKNLYIIPKAVNMSTKQRVENYVYDNPENTKTIKKIDEYFKKNKLTYYDRRNKKYRGAKPSKSAVDLAQLGFTKTSQLKNLFTGTYKDSKGKTRVITKDVAKLISDLNERNIARGGTTLEDDIKIVQKAAANQGVRFNSFAGFMDFTEMGIELPPAVKQAAARILDVGGKTLRGFGKAAVVLDPMFAAYDFSTAVGQGAGLKNSTEYMVKRFGEGVLNLPDLVASGGKFVKDKIKGKDAKFEQGTLYKPFDFAQRGLEEDLAAMSKSQKLRNIANKDFDVGIGAAMRMVDDTEIPASAEEIEKARQIYLQNQMGPYYKYGIENLVEEEPEEKSLPNEGLLRILSNPTYKGVL